MKAVQRFAVISSIILLCSTSVATAPQIAHAETTADTSGALTDAAPSQDNADLESNSGSEANSEEAPASTGENRDPSTPSEDGWHGGAGEPL